MPKRTPEQDVRDARERAFRRLKSLLELHWSMLGSYVAAERPDPELRRRLLNTRWSILELVADMLPTPGVPLALEDEAAKDRPPSVH
jgi:hypothetical protein